MDAWFDGMLQTCSRRTRSVLFLARLKAGERGAHALEPEDILAGLIVEDQGGVGAALSDLRGPTDARSLPAASPHRPFLDAGLADKLLGQVKALHSWREPVPASSGIPMSEAAQRTVTGAVTLRLGLQQNQLEPLHLLAAIAGDGSSRVGGLLRNAGITREDIVKAAREQAGFRAEAEAAERFAGYAGPSLYSQRARNVLFLARAKARIRGSPVMEVGDVIAAFMIEDQGRLAEALSGISGAALNAPELGQAHRPFLPPATAEALRFRVESLCTRSQPLAPAAEVAPSADLKRALAKAGELVTDFGGGAIDPLHLLAAITTLEPKPCTQILSEAGLNRETVLSAIQRDEGGKAQP